MNLFSRIRRFSRKKLHVDGFRMAPATYWPMRRVDFLRQLGVDCVIDVGANDGGYAGELFEFGFAGRVVSFEPLPSAWERLAARASTSGHRWTVAPRVALGRETGEVRFYEAGNSVSSSILPMHENHRSACPESAYVAEHLVPVRRLDDLAGEIGLPDHGTLCLKVDVQGAEHLVLEGARDLLARRVAVVELEMSLAPLYDGQSPFEDLDRYLRERGFEPWDLVPGFRDPRTHRMLQLDGFYVRKPA